MSNTWSFTSTNSFHFILSSSIKSMPFIFSNGINLNDICYIRFLCIWYIVLLSLTVKGILNIHPRKCLGHSSWPVTAIYFPLLSSSHVQNCPELQAYPYLDLFQHIDHICVFCFSLEVWVGSCYILTKNCFSLCIIDLFICFFSPK